MLIEADSLLVLIMYHEHSDGENFCGGRVNETVCSIKGEQFLD